MRRCKYGVVSPPNLVALQAYQREADRQANRWIERELMGLMRGREAFGGNQPRITYTREGKRATMSHGVA